MAMAIVSMRSSCRSFSSCWALRNEAGEAGVRSSGSGNSGSGLGDPSVGKMHISSSKSRAAPCSRGGERPRERSAKTLEASAACAAKVANKIDLAGYGCATCVRKGLEMQLFSVAKMHFIRAVWR
jgi:hypothetical protein